MGPLMNEALPVLALDTPPLPRRLPLSSVQLECGWKQENNMSTTTFLHIQNNNKNGLFIG